MSTVSFIKYHGAGNDFIVIDNRAPVFPIENPSWIERLCHRRFGIGADGVILLSLHPSADFHMRIFNRDGFEATGCGNGLRCLAHFIQELPIRQKRFRIKMGERIVETFFKRGAPVIDMGFLQEIHLGVETEKGIVHRVDSGAPHVVQFVPDVGLIDLNKEGSFLRKKFQANVNFASFLSDRSFRVRTFEKGVEGETLSCGTGALAVGALGTRLFGLQGTVAIHYPGGVLEVWEEEGRMVLTGPVEKVFTGAFLLAN